MYYSTGIIKDQDPLSQSHSLLIIMVGVSYHCPGWLVGWLGTMDRDTKVRVETVQWTFVSSIEHPTFSRDLRPPAWNYSSALEDCRLLSQACWRFSVDSEHSLVSELPVEKVGQ